MVMNPFEYPEQVIKKQVTVASGETSELYISIPSDVQAWLVGYGYNWYADHIYQIDTGELALPKRTDQEGSLAQPVRYGSPFRCSAGGRLRLLITNNQTADVTHTAVFIIRTTTLLTEESAGGDLIFNTGSQRRGIVSSSSEPILIDINVGSVSSNSDWLEAWRMSFENGLVLENNSLHFYARWIGSTNRPLSVRITRLRDDTYTVVGASDTGGGGNPASYTSNTWDIGGWQTGDVAILEFRKSDPVGSNDISNWRLYGTLTEAIPDYVANADADESPSGV